MNKIEVVNLNSLKVLEILKKVELNRNSIKDDVIIEVCTSNKIVLDWYKGYREREDKRIEELDQYDENGELIDNEEEYLISIDIFNMYDPNDNTCDVLIKSTRDTNIKIMDMMK